MEELILIGEIHKSFGLDGRIKVNIEDAYWDHFVDASFLFIEIDGQKIPFFVEDRSISGVITVRLEGIDSPEKAQVFQNALVFLPAGQVDLEKNDPFDPEDSYFFLNGYHMQDIQYGKVGLIVAIQEYPSQIIAMVQTASGEKMIPLNQHFIREIKEKERIVLTELPDGLLEI